MKRQIFLVILLSSLLIIPTTSFSQKRKLKKWNQKRIDASIVTVDEEIFQGQILEVNEQKIELWMSKDPYSSTRNDVEIKTFSPEEVKQIKLNRRGRFGKKIALLSGTSTLFLISTTNLTSISLDSQGQITARSATAGVIASSILGTMVGSILGSIWGLSTRVSKNIQVEGDVQNYLKKLPKIKARSLMENEWGNEFYWERQEG